MRIKPQLCLLAASLLSASFVSSAGDEPVNCRNEQTGVVNLYEGYASCYAPTPSGLVSIGRYVHPTTSPTAIISEYVNGTWTQCTASVPFVDQQPVYKEVCDYKPSAFLTIDNFSYGEVYVKARGADRDGTFTVQLYVDGKLQPRTSAFLNAFSGEYTLGQYVKVESVVTDNDGYVTRKVDWALLEDTGVIQPF